jgi:hypothetical protein
MTSQDPNTFSLQSIPDVTVVIVVTGEKDPTGNRESDRGYTAQDVVVGVLVQFPIGS